jgi:hypothetical protein
MVDSHLKKNHRSNARVKGVTKTQSILHYGGRWPSTALALPNLESSKA